jgi:hypothetical protein
MNEEKLTTFSEVDRAALEPMMKVGLLATVTPEGLPHLTLLSSLRPSTADQMTFGQFVEGASKKQLRENPKAGFLAMTLNKDLWRGKATFTHTARHGREFEQYNETPMFRYNAYFGVHTVYYLDLVEQSGRQALPMGKVILAAVQTMLARPLARQRSPEPVLNPWTQGLLNKLDNLKFLSYVGPDGYPVIIPTIQAQAADAEHVIFSLGAYGDELAEIPPGATVSVFGMSLDMVDVLLRGEFQGLEKAPAVPLIPGLRYGRIRVNWVYSPMPPKPEQIYPRVAIEPVTVF